jgi:DNA-binding transcriptional regulator YiaG
VCDVKTIRDIRQATGYSQRSFAARLEIRFETYRAYDSGRRLVPREIVEHATSILRQHRRDTELFTLDILAREYHIHARTLRTAARDGRLTVQHSNRAVFGRPIRFASREAIDEFVRRHYRHRYSRFAPPIMPHRLPAMPSNFASRLIGLRLRLRITQGELSRRIGAASKAVVYQWESRKRTPSPEFWRRIEQLRGGSPGTDPEPSR